MTLEQKKARSELLETIRNEDMAKFACPICSQPPSRSITLGRIDRHNLPLTTVICLECGSPRSKEVLRSESLENFYGNNYRRLYHTSNGPDDDFFRDQFTRGLRLAKIVEPFLESRARVLEIGCGAGGIVSAFLDRGYQPTGIDFDVDYLEFGRSRGLDLRNTALEKWDEKVDAIVLSHVLEHLTHPSEFLRSVGANLKENGILIVEVPNIFSLWRTYGGSLRTYLQYAHVFHFDRWSLRQVTQASGFKCMYSDSLTIGVYQKQAQIAEDFPELESWQRLRRISSLIAFLLISRLLSLALLPSLKLAQALVREVRARKKR